MNRTRTAAIGVVAVVTAIGAGLVVWLSSGGAEPAQPVTTPAAEIVTPTTTTSTAVVEPTSTTLAAPQGAVDAPQVQRENEPVDENPEIPPPGVPYDSDGHVGELNPPNMKPGEVAPQPAPAPITTTLTPIPVQPGPPTQTTQTTQD